MNSEREAPKSLPYLSIFHKESENEAVKEKLLDIFMKPYPIKCQVKCQVDRKYRKLANLRDNLSAHSYEIALSHGEFKWSIQRTYQQFLALHGKIEIIPKLKGIKLEKNIAHKLPTHKPFPNEEIIKVFEKELGVYLEAVLAQEAAQYHKSMRKFLEVSWLSFIGELGAKYKEGFVKKKVGHQHVKREILGVVQGVQSKIHSKWTKNWLVLKESCLIIVRPSDNLIREVILMDQAFYVYKSSEHRHSMTIYNLNRNLTLACKNKEDLNDWLNKINQVAHKAEGFVQPNRLSSFAPVRKRILAKWFVDGESYFESIAEVLENAKEEIFITDWMLSPELYLKRPITDDAYYRLDKILERKALAGVRVFVIIFEDVKIAMGLDSIYVKKRLQSLHPNIRVLRRRGFTQIMVWSPHDKMVIVDQQYAFFGGIDMCFGRWDNYLHKLTDFGNNLPTVGKSFKSVVSSLVTRMTAVPEDIDPAGSIAKLSTTSSLKSETNSASYTSSASQLVYVPDGKLWPGKDYMNFIFKDFKHVDTPFEDLIDRTVMPRMPWHDIACFVQGFPARDLARHFIQRWNVTKLDVKKEDTSYPLILPKAHLRYLKQLKPKLTLMTKVDCQMLRSATNWSAGIRETEHSIHNAYIKAISEAEHFIYIENQFFVSLMDGNSLVFNKIADCLYERIIRAHNQKKTFRVYVVMPLLPGIEGDIKSESGVAIKAVTHYNYASICRGYNSLWKRLECHVSNPANYLTFCGLRTYEIVQDNLATELVYVHSKLLIADDRVAIIGSANINDRSLMGDRDCEVAAIFEDVYDQKEVTFAGAKCQVGHFVSSLRQHIFKEHLGMRENSNISYDISDPVCDDFFNNVWLKVASKNTKIFDKVFRCIPADAVTAIDELENYVKEPSLSETNVEKAKKKLKEIEGHLVLIPFFFLCKEDLAPSISTKEGIMPNVLWV